jgi:hypothetical protein
MEHLMVTMERVGQDLQRALDSSARWEKRARLLAAVVRLLLAWLRAFGLTLAVRPPIAVLVE